MCHRITPRDLARMIATLIAAPERIGVDVSHERYRAFVARVTEAACDYIGTGALVDVLQTDSAWRVVVKADEANLQERTLRWSHLDCDAEGTERGEAMRRLDQVLRDEVIA